MDEKVEKEANIDTKRVQALAEYICELLKAHGVEEENITQLVTDDIINNYSIVMNDRSIKGFDCSKLENVQALLSKGYSIPQRYLCVEIDETSIISEGAWWRDDSDGYDIIWMTPERTRKEYEDIIGKNKDRNYIVDSLFINDVKNIRRKRNALRRYINENGIEGINTDIEPLDIDHDMTNAIADLLMQEFGYDDIEKKAKTLEYLENNWSEILGEDHAIQFDDIHKSVFGNSIFNHDMIHLTDGMAYYADLLHPKVIYATPEALNRTALDTEKKFLTAYLSELRSANKKYAEEHGIKLDVYEPSKDEKVSESDEVDQSQGKTKDSTQGKKKERKSGLILPEDLKERGKEYMSGFHNMLERLQAKIDSGEIALGIKTKTLLTLYRTLCGLKDREAAARDLSQEYQEQLPEESKDER